MIYDQILERFQLNQKQFAVLVDPDKYGEDMLIDLVEISKRCKVDYFFIGGSLMTSDRFEKTIRILKSLSEIPVIIFPGSNVQISESADAILLLSLISGRNPEYLIGQHVVAAPYLKKSGLEVLSTGYMLIESSNNTTANYMSNSFPIPYDKSDVATYTALAGEMLGMKLIYMDGGSGSGKTISGEMIQTVKKELNVPLIIGGGITNAEKAADLWSAGADIIVVGNAIEKDLSLIESIAKHTETHI